MIVAVLLAINAEKWKQKRDQENFLLDRLCHFTHKRTLLGNSVLIALVKTTSSHFLPPSGKVLGFEYF
jgi:hypothetical protein